MSASVPPIIGPELKAKEETQKSVAYQKRGKKRLKYEIEQLTKRKTKIHTKIYA
jgi:hypothetical protein